MQRTSKNQAYYRPNDFEDTLKRLPEVIKNAETRSIETLEPTIYEQREIMKLVKEFVKSKGRKIYGGTAINELIKSKNPKEAIYDDYNFGDIDFYSTQPRVDVVDLCDFLYEKKKYKNISANEAQHEETYRIYVNWQLYCNITYVPKRIYSGIKVEIIDGVQYAHPHFIWIDQLRIYNNPMLCSRMWEKTFKREFFLLKNWPLEFFDGNFNVTTANPEIIGYQQKIKDDFLKNNGDVLINGFDAYNFYMRYGGEGKLEKNVPFLELTSVNYIETVINLFTAVMKMVRKPETLTIHEYTPFFQFVGHSVMINYNDVPLVSVSEVSNTCIPVINVSSGLKYASYQYLLMSLLMNKFRSFLDNDKPTYFDYGIAISNLVRVKNNYLNEKNYKVINESPFTEFRTACIGNAISPTRLYLTRRNERKENGKRVEFTYSPENFFKMADEMQKKFIPENFKYHNTSGNIIIKPENTRFYFDGKILTERVNTLPSEEEQS